VFSSSVSAKMSGELIPTNKAVITRNNDFNAFWLLLS